ncbi:MAG: histidine--tRNA ligase [Thermoplasmata archaeon]|nr:MAG: histidine--tRNA ligase [Thermoplasmata archaeon]
MISKPRGTRDFTPEEMRRRRWLEQKMRSIFEKYGYEEIATPTIEHLDLFTLKSGEGIIEETYAFEDKAGRKLALRPELTAPVMRFYVERFQMETKPIKFYYFGNCFRYDRPQKGRYREFWQFGCELIGSDKPEAIAELIAMAYNILRESGLRNIILRVGNLDILRRFLDSIGARDAEIMRLIDKKDFEELEKKMEEKEFKEFMKFIEIKKIEEIEYEEADRMKEIFEFLEEFAIPYNLDLSIARGLDYYIGVVFEIDAPKLGAEKQICGGGEYNLVPLLGGRKIPTAGFAIGFDRTLLALETEGFKFEEENKPVYIAYMEDMIKEAIKIVRMVRQHDIKAEMDLMRRSISKSLEYANKKGFNKVIIVAPDEWKKNKVILKDMEKREQKEVEIESLPQLLKNQA